MNGTLPGIVSMFRFSDLLGNYSAENFARAERLASEKTGAPHAIIAGSGSTALWIALKALGCKKVALPAFTCPSVFLAVQKAGAKAILVDVETETFGMDFDAIPKSADCAVAEHAYGIPLDTKKIIEANERLPVAEDFVRGFGSEFDGKKIGCNGTAGFISFGFGKSFGAGKGGMLFTKDGKIAEKARRLLAGLPKNGFGIAEMKAFCGYGSANEWTYPLLRKFHRPAGWGAELARADNVAVQVFLNQLERFDSVAELRHNNFCALHKRLSKSRKAVLPAIKKRKIAAPYFPVVLQGIERRMAIEMFAKAGLTVNPKFPMPLNKVFGVKGRFPNAERTAGTYIEIPLTLPEKKFAGIAEKAAEILG
ncbi:MAG: DegT/DnrJ/EryC1/StrS family aminotransferase [Candidatus Diapherotrites archaeon]|nr:DegT/DnrJ/EryC1/StrS family aminotransferase [Candidatus Diapherotrites archaeon]